MRVASAGLRTCALGLGLRRFAAGLCEGMPQSFDLVRHDRLSKGREVLRSGRSGQVGHYPRDPTHVDFAGTACPHNAIAIPQLDLLCTQLPVSSTPIEAGTN